MRPSIVLLAILGLGAFHSISCLAQSACSPAPLSAAVKTESTARRQLRSLAVNLNDPQVPPVVDAALAQWKNALAQGTGVVFACAGANDTPESLEKTLATAFHANLPDAEESDVITNHKETGAYGSNLTVQVFPLFNAPRYFEVDLRYTIECGDDNLLLVFKAERNAAGAKWTEVLRWGAPHYTTVADAYGDFILLTPLTGFAVQRNWRFAVAHGQPGCAATASNNASPNAGPNATASRFDLDLLEPSIDPAQSHIVWHLEQPYTRGQVPRLATTENTLSLEFRPPDDDPAQAKHASAAPAASYRYRIDADNHVRALTAPTPEPASTHLPQ